jgi:hypothetical protein
MAHPEMGYQVPSTSNKEWRTRLPKGKSGGFDQWISGALAVSEKPEV